MTGRPSPTFVLLAVIAIAFAYWISATALQKGISLLDRTILLVVAGAAIGLMVRNSTSLRNALAHRDWSKARLDGDGVNLFLNFLAIATASLTLMAPRPATESEPGILESLVTGIAADTQATRADAAVTRIAVEEIQDDLAQAREPADFTRLAGIWGEEGCRVTYRFAVEGNRLEVTTDRSLDDMEEGRWLFSIEADSARSMDANRDRMSVITEEIEGPFSGSLVRFTVDGAGAIDRLTWDNRDRNQSALQLRSCSASISPQVDK